MKCLILPLLLAGCAPTYYGVKPFYGTLDLGQRDIDAVEQGVMFEVGWSPQTRTHQKRMEDYAVASLAANPNVDREWLQDMADEAAGDEGEEHLPFMPDIPENEDDRWNILAYGAVGLMLASAYWIFKRATAKPEE